MSSVSLRAETGRASRTLLDEREWLIADGLGGFAMGTVSGIPTRKYHALLVSAQSPPVDRVVLLHDVVARLLPDDGPPIELSLFAFDDHGSVHLHPGSESRRPEFEFNAEAGTARWTWDVPEVSGRVRRTLVRHDAEPRATIEFEWPEGVRFEARPIASPRSMHEVHEPLAVHEDPAADGRGVRVRRGHWEVELAAEHASFVPSPDWWRGFRYEHEIDRGFHAVEDLFTPGYFESDRGRMTITARDPRAAASSPTRAARQRQHLEAIGRPADPAVRRLVQAADAFVVKRDEHASIIAGYPWFADWGRDSMISLPGLLLVTGRFDEALGVLRAFGENLNPEGGLIPNRFADDGSGPLYNTADASLWFLHAACAYRDASGDRAGYARFLEPACESIVRGYLAGQPGNIGVDDDGLVFAGDETTQLTWMDAERDGTVFTPRHGKPVELSALWHHGLLSMAGSADEPRAAELRALADRTGQSFRSRFFDASLGWCVDCIGPDGPIAELRPNQLFAVSLAHSPLERAHQRSLVDACIEALWTARGVRTLAPTDPAYIARYAGPIVERDAAYHQGTAWPWLLGAMTEGLLRANEWSDDSRQRARDFIRPMLDELDGPCEGQLFEVYDGGDGEAPQRPGGCPAQAWSVAEVLRVALLIDRPGAG